MDTYKINHQIMNRKSEMLPTSASDFVVAFAAQTVTVTFTTTLTLLVLTSQMFLLLEQDGKVAANLFGILLSPLFHI